MYIYDHKISGPGAVYEDQPVILRPSQRYDYATLAPFLVDRHALGQSLSAPTSHNTPGQALDPLSDYVLAPEVMDAVEKLLSTPVPAGHLSALGPNVNPLMVERGLTIYRFNDGRLEVGPIRSGAKPRKLKSGAIRYSLQLLSKPYKVLDASGQIIRQAPPWLFIHTHPKVRDIPEIPSGILKEGTSLFGDLNTLRKEPHHQIGIMTIGFNHVIASFRSAPQAIPFTLAIRGPIPINVKPKLTPTMSTRDFRTHKAAAKALRLMFPSPTVSAYYTGDLRTGTATPYLSRRQLRKKGKMEAKAGK